jgi:hypothetical protein
LKSRKDSSNCRRRKNFRGKNRGSSSWNRPDGSRRKSRKGKNRSELKITARKMKRKTRNI